MRSLLPALAALMLAACTREPAGRVDAADYDAFWLWAGVRPQPVLEGARIVYLLAGEVRRDTGAFVSLRSGTPRLTVPSLWLVVRVDTLRWKRGTTARIVNEAARWRAAGNNLAGVQIDFDARTRHLGEYARFLRSFRAALPRSTRLSVTGLMDWSANGDPIALNALSRTVDEVVIQTYQGRTTIPGYARYLDRTPGMIIPFRIGIVQGGEWRAPPSLDRMPNFKGYVVFLVNAQDARPRSE